MDRYKKIQDGYLGQGAYGVVEKYLRQSDRQVFACKVIRFRDAERHRSQAHQEYSVLSALSHPNIVSYVDIVWESTAAHIFMNLCNGGSLADFIEYRIQNGATPVSEAYISSVFSQLASALLYCHHGIAIHSDGTARGSFFNWNPILHRDIKPGNIMLSTRVETEHIVAQLGDFGLSTFIDFDKAPSTYAGTKQYLAPEISRSNRARNHWTKMCDIFSLGCSIWELASLVAPFSGHMDNDDDEYKSIPDTYSAKLNARIAACMSIPPDRRPDASDLLRSLRRYQEEMGFLKNLQTMSTSQSPPAPEVPLSQLDQFSRIALAAEQSRTSINTTSTDRASMKLPVLLKSTLSLHVVFRVIWRKGQSLYRISNLEFRLRPDCTIEDIKKRIEEYKGFPIDRQVLSRGQVLEDQCLLCDSGVEDRGVIDLVANVAENLQFPSKMNQPQTEVIVRNTKDIETYFVYLDQSCRISDVKERLHQFGKALPDQQQLLHCGWTLSDEQALGDIQVSRDPVIHLIVSPDIRKSKVIQLIVDATSWHPQRLTENDQPHKYTMRINIYDFELVYHIKSRLRSRGNYPVYRQELVFNGCPLLNDQTIRQCQLRDNDVVFLSANNKYDDPHYSLLTLAVKILESNECHIQVDSLSLIGDIKGEIETTNYAILEKYQLYYAGVCLDESETLQSQDIPSGATIYLHSGPLAPVYYVNVQRLHEKTFELRANALGLVRHVKEEIELTTAIPVSEQVLYFGSTLLEDNQVLYEYKLSLESKISLSRQPARPIILRVIREQGSYIRVEVNPSDVIWNIKEAISRQEGIPTSDQWLIHNGVTLSDTDSIQRYGIKSGSIICLNLETGSILPMSEAPRNSESLVHLNIRTRETTLPHVSLKRSSSIYDVKKEAHAHLLLSSSCTPRSMELYYLGQILDNKTTLHQIGFALTASLYLIKRPAEINGTTTVRFINFDVITPTGKAIRMTVYDLCTIRDIKELVFDSTKIPVHQQSLYKRNSDFVLRDEWSLVNCGLRDEWSLVNCSTYTGSPLYLDAGVLPKQEKKSVLRRILDL